MRGDDAKQAMWDEFLGAFLDDYSPQELREAKTEKFMNLKQGKISMKEYVLKFQQLFHYSPELLSTMRSKIKKFASGFPMTWYWSVSL